MASVESVDLSSDPLSWTKETRLLLLLSMLLTKILSILNTYSSMILFTVDSHYQSRLVMVVLSLMEHSLKFTVKEILLTLSGVNLV